MNSNEGIYSLGMKSATKTTATRENSNNKLGIYDSDDASEELAKGSSTGEQDVPTKDGWCSSHCSWNDIANSDSSRIACPPQFKTNEPDELLSFINSLLPEGGRTSAFRRPSRHTSDCQDPNHQERKEGEPFPDVQSERARNQCPQGRTQSANGRPRPLSLLKAVGDSRCSQSEESILCMLDVEAELQEIAQEDFSTRQGAETLEGHQNTLAFTPTGSPAGLPHRKLTKPTVRSALSRIHNSARPCAPLPHMSQGSSSDTSQDRSPCYLNANARTFRTGRVANWRTPNHGSAEGEQPTRDHHCKSTPTKGKLRSPSPPPPPPGRSTSLLVRPHQQLRAPLQSSSSRAPPPSYHTSLLPSLQATLPIRDKEPSRTTQQSHKSPAVEATAKGRTRRSAKSDCTAPPAPSSPPDTGHNCTRTSKNVPPPYSALRCSVSAFPTKKGSLQKELTSPTVMRCPTPNMPGKVGKTRIPMGFKAFLKAQPTCKSSDVLSGKQEKDHLNSVSRESVTSDHYSSLVFTAGSTTGRLSLNDMEKGQQGLDKSGEAQRRSQVFCRAPCRKPVLGLTGATARTQSFSSPHHKLPTAESSQVRSRNHIITTSGERGEAGSLTRKSSLEVPSPILPSTGLTHSPPHSPRARFSHYEGVAVPSAEHGGLRNVVHQAQVCVNPFPSPAPSSGQMLSEQCPTNTAYQSDNSPKVSPSMCSIEEKVMLGIEENVQKTQDNQEKMALSETRTRTKTTSSLANWFGLRRSKLPALGGKKVNEASRAKEDKEEKKTSQAEGVKADRRKEEEKNQEAVLEVNNKLSSIMDHCNNHMGHIANHIHTTTAFIGNEQLVRKLLGRLVSPSGILGCSHSSRSDTVDTQKQKHLWPQVQIVVTKNMHLPVSKFTFRCTKLFFSPWTVVFHVKCLFVKSRNCANI